MVRIMTLSFAVAAMLAIAFWISQRRAIDVSTLQACRRREHHAHGWQRALFQGDCDPQESAAGQVGPSTDRSEKSPFLMQPAAGGMHIELLIIGQLTLRHTAEIVREASC